MLHYYLLQLKKIQINFHKYLLSIFFSINVAHILQLNKQPPKNFSKYLQSIFEFHQTQIYKNIIIPNFCVS